jgi:hypothetical protein
MQYDQATTELKQAGLDEYLREAAAEAEKMAAECVENAFYFKAFLKPKSYMAFVVMTRRGVIRRFLFVFDHRGIRFVNETGEIIRDAISSILTDLNWSSAGEEGRAAIYENAVIKHLSPEELEKLADAQLAIEAAPGLKRELIDEILARTWEPEKPEELTVMLKDGLHETLGVPSEQVDEVVLKIRREDIDRFKALADQLKAARTVEHAVLHEGSDRLVASGELD